MKRIINGKRYDTETAELVAEWSNNYPCNDFNYYSEELYRKKTGEYFLYGEGGPMSKYSKEIGQNSWSGGERITPLTLVEAQKWAERLDGDKYEEIFGEVEEDKKQISTWIELSLKKRFDAMQDVTLRDVFAAGIQALEDK